MSHRTFKVLVTVLDVSTVSTQSAAFSHLVLGENTVLWPDLITRAAVDASPTAPHS